MKRFHIWTIGCQMNKADSGFIAGCLEQAGLTPAASVGEADLVVLNSCVVREHAETRVVNKLRSLKGLKRNHPDVLIALTGCMVDSRTDELKERFPWVDLFFRPQQWEALSGWAEKHDLPGLAQAGPLLPREAPVSAYVPVMHGCDSFCSYCIVPFRRGRAQSRPPGEICCEARGLVERGARELVLLGQIVDAYGNDLPSRPDLADLLGQLNGIEGLCRVRFLTSHPGYVSRKLIGAIADLDKVCRHISLPIQAGDDAILRAMKRGYTVAEYLGLVADIRRGIPGVALSTDVIVGFPGESEAQFEGTMEVLRRARFDQVHIAAYSPRPGTAAARQMPDDIPAETKETRRSRAEALQNAIAAEINSAYLGQTVMVLVEGQKKGKWWGRTEGDKLVFFAAEGPLIGRLAGVRIGKTSPLSLQGTMA